jgi:hypothetical protein
MNARNGKHEKSLEEKSRGKPQPSPAERGAPEYYAKDQKPKVGTPPPEASQSDECDER